MERAPYAVLLAGEHYWKDRYHWLLDRGFQLRSRYHPDWVPTWEQDPSRDENDGDDYISTSVSTKYLLLLAANSVDVP